MYDRSKMSYYKDIENCLDIHLHDLESLAPKDQLSEKVISHFEQTEKVLNNITRQRPEDYRLLIEYLYNEGRRFGWSYPEDKDEEACETSFWRLKDSIKEIIEGMTGNERLYFFGYLEEYENLNPKHRSEKEKIELKLFMK